MNLIYLDYNATTPLDPRVAEAMRPFLEGLYGNPSSAHPFGLEAKVAVEEARRHVAAMLNARPDEIVFTSGGSESNNFALKGAAYANRNKGNHIITTAIEHPAVAEVCRYLGDRGFRITYAGVDETGLVNPDDIERAITRETILISVMHANNEVGTIQPLEEIGRIARSRGILFHSDAAQSVGKIPVDVLKAGVDLLSVAGHKFYAPKGIGALYIRRGVQIEKQILGADHESDRRAGTENVIHIAGLGKAAEIITHSYSNGPADEGSSLNAGIKELRDLLYDGIHAEIPGISLNGNPHLRLPNTLSVGFPGVESAILLNAMEGIAASAGAACHTGSQEVSGVLAAMKVPYEHALGTIRFSLGRMTSRAEIESAIPIIVNAWRKCAGKDTLPDVTDRPVLLTQYTHALGCACKIRPQLLERILNKLPLVSHPDILVGHETSDDAAVYRISEHQAIVQTVDFIPPVVDDPYSFGAIASANALSDIYAMGGTPLFALSIVAFPDARLPLDVLHQILKGAGDKVAEAGIQIIGGHSVEDTEPKFGLVVTGIIEPGKILKNSGANPGDALVLTKPLGTGIITTAIKRGLADAPAIGLVTREMSRLNRQAAETMERYPVSACTDVSGFGLLGHLKEMVNGAGIQVVIRCDDVPVIPAAWEYASAGMIPGGTRNNLEFAGDLIQWEEGIPELNRIILADAQTSGGLLVALPRVHAAAFTEALKANGNPDAAIIGEFRKGPVSIHVQRS
jgi:cysteine desulfurase NifS/selenium donor protein